jgi:hypothetical protein
MKIMIHQKQSAAVRVLIEMMGSAVFPLPEAGALNCSNPLAGSQLS